MKKINRIFLLGDSFVEGQGTYEEIDKMGNFLEPNIFIEDLSDWRKENSWNKFVLEKINCQVFNYARQGSDNYSMFSQLNHLLRNELTPNDLVIFGFTSKLRDTGYSINYGFKQNHEHRTLLHPNNPLGGKIAWEKSLLYKDKYFTELDGYSEYKTDFEKKFTKHYVEDFFTTIYNPQVYETIAQSNYLFYQNWFKEKNLNILFFDIFEKYIDEDFVQDGFNINRDMYISYKSKSLIDVLYEYEDKNIKEGEVSVWEYGQYKPTQIIHANQHGYKVFVDYLFDKFLYKKYEFETNTL